MLSGQDEQVFWTVPPQRPSCEKVFSVGLEPQDRIHANHAAEIFNRGLQNQVLGKFGTLDFPSMARMCSQAPKDSRAGFPGAISIGNRTAPMPPEMQHCVSLLAVQRHAFNSVRPVALGISSMHRPVGPTAMLESGSAAKRPASASVSPQPPVVRQQKHPPKFAPSGDSVHGFTADPSGDFYCRLNGDYY